MTTARVMANAVPRVGAAGPAAGTVVGAVVGVVAVLSDPSVDAGRPGVAVAAFLFGAVYGAAVGVAVGLVAGLAVGAATRTFFLPLRDPARHRFVASAVCAVLAVGMAAVVLGWGLLGARWVAAPTWQDWAWGVVLASAVGLPAWWSGRRFAAWYEEAAGA